jgi:hypothetical protein
MSLEASAPEAARRWRRARILAWATATLTLFVLVPFLGLLCCGGLAFDLAGQALTALTTTPEDDTMSSVQAVLSVAFFLVICSGLTVAIVWAVARTFTWTRRAGWRTRLEVQEALALRRDGATSPLIDPPATIDARTVVFDDPGFAVGTTWVVVRLQGGDCSIAWRAEGEAEP